MGLFGGTSERGDLLDLQARVARLEEQVARLTAALGAADARPAADPAPVGDAHVGDVYAEARALAASGDQIRAIKVVRDRTGVSLRSAKDLVDSW